jgi:hypothetical protein
MQTGALIECFEYFADVEKSENKKIKNKNSDE